jgi:filamentous hemagglutinin family protein
MNCDRWLWILAVVLLPSLVMPEARSQVVADETLGTQVTRNGETLTIRGGTRLEKNVFHSFRQFSVERNSVADFQADAGVGNILVRVTGGSRSRIEGTLRSLSQANVFLMNPNGILFGRNAQLDLGGSFVGTTASAILFPNGGEFSLTSAVSPQNELLTVNPSALLVNQVSGAIQIRSATLAVSPGKTLLLVGGDVELQRGHLFAESGRLEIAAIAMGAIDLTFDAAQQPQLSLPQRWTGADLRIDSSEFNVSGTEGNGNQDGGVLRLFAGSIMATERDDQNRWDARGNTQGQGGEIHFLATGQISLQGSLTAEAIATGLNGGSISLTAGGRLQLIGSNTHLTNQTYGAGRGGDIRLIGRSIEIEGASILTNAYGSGNAGSVMLEAIGQVQMRSREPRPLGISTNTGRNSSGNGGDILIRAGSFRMDGTLLAAFTAGQGKSGDILIDVGAGEVSLISSQIAANTEQQGRGGNIRIRAGNLMLRDGVVIAITDRSGDAGSIDLTARSLEVTQTAVGLPEFLRLRVVAPGIYTSTTDSGQAGNLTIAVDRLRVQGGARISASTAGAGNGGQLRVTATETLELVGRGSGLFAETTERSTGRGGNIVVRAPGAVEIQDQATIAVDSAGAGQGGNIRVQAGTLALRDQGRISAETQSTQGGNISLQIQDLIVLRSRSQISATAGLAQKQGDGGNIAIATPFVISVLPENNDIRANAFIGRGGNIDIRTNGIFGIEVQPEDTRNSDITASSERGPSGVIAINSLDTDPSRGLVPLTTTLVDPSSQIAQSCATASRNPSSFTVTGRGGLPPSPIDALRSESALSNWISLEPLSTLPPVAAKIAATQPIVEAQTWHRDPKGDLYLIARSPASQLPAIANPCP